MPRHKSGLTDAFIRGIMEAGRYSDGPGSNGLVLRAKPLKAGDFSRIFWQRIRIDGEPAELRIGKYPLIGLKTARKLSTKNAQIVEEGGDPREKKKVVPTLAEVAEEFWVLRVENKGPTYLRNRRARLRRYAPQLLDKRVDRITRDDITGVLSPIWRGNNSMANELRNWVSMIFEYAVGMGYIQDNPADRPILRTLPDVRQDVINHPSLPYRDIESYINELRQVNDRDISGSLALEFKTYTITRSIEVCNAPWSEIHLDFEVFTPKTKGSPSLTWPCWVIPPERYKTKTGVIIPLSRQAIRVLVEAIDLSGRHPYLIFPSEQGVPHTASSLALTHHEVSKATVPHGIRDSFKSWCQEYEVSERLAKTSMGHAISTHDGAYGRSVLAAKRINLVQDWADYNRGETPPNYEWHDKFKPEQVHTYPDKDDLLIREDIGALRAHLESDIAGAFYKGIQDTFAAIRAADANSTYKASVLFMSLTDQNYESVRKARLSEIDTGTGVWTIPAGHIGKLGRPLPVPLPKLALSIVKQMQQLEGRGNSEILFPSQQGTALRSNTASQLLHTLHIDLSPAIFKSAFREWCVKSGVPHEIVGDAIGLKRTEPLTETERPDTLKQRRRPMQKWAEFLEGKLPLD